MALITKYRPKTLDDVIGQEAVTKALGKSIAKGTPPHAFLFAGPPGTGKTSLARIAALDLDIISKDILEIDAASRTGIDDMREIRSTVLYKAFGVASSSGRRAIILDEAHRLSAQAWDSLLKEIEEPPPHLFWFFCTTNLAKVPASIKSRCAVFNLKEVSEENLTSLVTFVARKEQLKPSPDVLSLIVREANGSPRQALSNLEVAGDAANKKEAAALLQVALESDVIIQFARFIIGHERPWKKAALLLTKIKESGENPESVRIVLVNYIGAVLANADTDKKAGHLLEALDAFSTPYNSAEKLAPLYLSTGRLILGA